MITGIEEETFTSYDNFEDIDVDGDEEGLNDLDDEEEIEDDFDDDFEEDIGGDEE